MVEQQCQCAAAIGVAGDALVDKAKSVGLVLALDDDPGIEIAATDPDTCQLTGILLDFKVSSGGVRARRQCLGATGQHSFGTLSCIDAHTSVGGVGAIEFARAIELVGHAIVKTHEDGAAFGVGVELYHVGNIIVCP